MIQVGKVYNEGLNDNQEVEIKILSINDNVVEAEVVKLGQFFSQECLKNGFILGERLLLTRKSDGNKIWWIVVSPKNRPWHILTNEKFQHYR